MTYWTDLLTEMGAGLLYGLVGIVLLALGYGMLDLLTPGRLGQRLATERNVNGGIIVAAGMLAVGLIVAAAIMASDGELLHGLGQAGGFGVVGVVLLGVAFVVIDVLTPGKLGESVMGEDGHEPMVWVTAATLLAVGGIVAASIS